MAGLNARGSEPGAEDPFAKACAAHAAELYSVARHVLHDREWAEDCVLETLLRLRRSPAAHRDERGSLRAFLIAAVRNDALDQLRAPSGRSRQTVPNFELPGADVRLIDPVEAERVRDALAALPAEQRDALLRAYYKNRSLQQIADERETSAQAVSAALQAALERLDAASVRAVVL